MGGICVGSSKIKILQYADVTIFLFDGFVSSLRETVKFWVILSERWG